MSRFDFYSKELKNKTEKIYQEVAEDLGLTYPVVAACVRDGLFKYIKEEVFKNFLNIQIRGFGTFYISKRMIRRLTGKKKEELYGSRKFKKDAASVGIFTN